MNGQHCEIKKKSIYSTPSFHNLPYDIWETLLPHEQI